MLLFRSEEHVERWRRQWRQRRGALLSLAQGWGLAEEWYRDRLAHDWRGKTMEEAESAFARLGLRGTFWKMKPRRSAGRAAR
jgi:hypothetical protein